LTLAFFELMVLRGPALAEEYRSSGGDVYGVVTSVVRLENGVPSMTRFALAG
jgi:hypothetical protein